MNISEFDFGAELSEATDHIRVWPKEGEMTALVDGDLLPYIIGYSIDDMMWLRANNRVDDGKCNSLRDTPEFEEVKQKLCMTMNRWITGAQCDSAYIYMTDSASNFRLDIAIQRPYKGTRKAEKPPFFYELREFMVQHLGAILSEGEEADDLITIHLWSEFNRLKGAGVELGSNAHKQLATLVAVSKDKDIAISSGWHYNVQANKLHWVTLLGELYPRWEPSKITGKMGMTELKGNGLKFFYAQLMLGDSVDNYTGIPRMKKQAIFDLLEPCKTEAELFYATLSAYNLKYTEKGKVESTYIHNFRGGGRWMKPYEIMLEQGRLAHMQQYKGELWRANKAPVLWGNQESLWLN